MYALVSNNQVVKYPYQQWMLSFDNPQTSFPENMSDEQLKNFGVFKISKSPAPAYNQATQTCREINPQFINGILVQAWEVLDMDMDTVASNVRAVRNKLLDRSDWTQVLDAQVDRPAWAAYRQALRDITIQPGFPADVSWPTPPQS